MVQGRGLVLLMAAFGCVTVGVTPPPHPDRVGQVFTQVQAAEAEHMGIDTRAHQLRRQARRHYREATEAMAKGDGRLAMRLFDRAQVDAELSVALARQEAWMQQMYERTATVMELRAPPPAATEGTR